MTDYARVCIEHPSCIGFTFGGLTDAASWYDYFVPFRWMTPNEPLLFDAELRPKPGYFGMLDALASRARQVKGDVPSLEVLHDD